MRIAIILVLALGLAACDERKSPDAPAPEFAELTFDGADAKDAPARLAHGKRIATILGCNGCHERNMQGRLFGKKNKIYAVNLTRELPKYNDSTLEKLLRTGVPIDGRDLWIMPSENFQHLSASDMTALIAFLRTVPPAGEPTPPAELGPEAQAEIAAGTRKSTKDWVAEAKARMPVDLGPSYAVGRYIASVTCAECHGFELEGNGKTTPDLVIAGAYSADEFRTLLRTGKPTGGRKLKLMERAATRRFSHLTDREIAALHAYLKARAERPQ